MAQIKPPPSHTPLQIQTPTERFCAWPRRLSAVELMLITLTHNVSNRKGGRDVGVCSLIIVKNLYTFFSQDETKITPKFDMLKSILSNKLHFYVISTSLSFNCIPLHFHVIQEALLLALDFSCLFYALPVKISFFFCNYFMSLWLQFPSLLNMCSHFNAALIKERANSVSHLWA